MKRSCCIVIFMCCAFSYGITQRREFLRQGREAMFVPDQLFSIEPATAGNGIADPSGYDAEGLRSAILSEMRKHSKNKRTALMESRHLMQICEITRKTISDSYFRKRKSNFKKLVRRVQHASLSKFGLIEVYSLEIPMIEDRKGDFYYDKKSAPGELGLYYNPEKLSKKEKAEGKKPEKKPVLLFTEAQLMEAIVGKLKRYKIYSELQGGNYYAAGLSVEVNQKTLYRKKVPMLRVVIAIGSKRMHLVQKKVEKSQKSKVQSF